MSNDNDKITHSETLRFRAPKQLADDMHAKALHLGMTTSEFMRHALRKAIGRR